ncbi:MAG: iron ABC transporter permease [Synergistaceae bacterium]|jgi:iron complex transport system permease protein|nr:iron ABC transporter permease [Synergistaceae bacterium]
MKKYRVAVFLALSLLILILCPWLGAQAISPSDIWGGSALESRIFWQLRLPRVILAWCAGATFGVCGMVFQAIFRNPLAEPSILGVSSGAALGAAVAIRFGLGMGILGAAALQTSAFVGAMLSIGIISTLSRMVKGTKDATLLLAGVAISSLFTSLIMVFQYTGGAAETYSLLSWTMGGISAVGMKEGLSAVPSLAIVLAMALRFSTELDLMLFGDDIASTRGVAIERTRRILFIGISVAVAIVVSNCGPIAFLGLIAPHVARRIVGPRHMALSMFTALTGGGALLLCDTAARTIWAPADLPVGIIISFLGAPFFLWLLFGPKDR